MFVECSNVIATCFLVCFWQVMLSLQAVTLLTTAEVINIIIIPCSVGFCPSWYRMSDRLAVYLELTNHLSLATHTES
jgi:hypothetical protein